MAAEDLEIIKEKKRNHGIINYELKLLNQSDKKLRN